MDHRNPDDDGTDPQTDRALAETLELSRRSFLGGVGVGLAGTATGVDGSGMADRADEMAVDESDASSSGDPPSIASVDRLTATDNGDPVYELQGSGFGNKSQGPAVLYDFVSETYENGHLNTFNGNFYDDGQDLHTAYSELDRIYDGMSIPEEAQRDDGPNRQDKPPAQYIADETEQPNRHEGVDAHYRFRNGSYIGLPMAYGGNHEGTDPDMERRYERPANKNQIYLAWWMRPEFGLQSHTVFQPKSIEGEIDFGDSKRDRGERFVIYGGGAGGIDVDGWVIGVRDGTGSSDNDDGRVEVEFDTKSNVNRIAGKTLIGQETGAKIEIPEDGEEAAIERFVSPNKLARIWESGGRDVGMAWGVNVLSLEESEWFGAEPTPKEWTLFETVIDLEAGFLEAWVDFEKKVDFEFDPQAVATDKSPTMQLIGMHTGDFGFNTFRISEVYQDSSIQRVVIADAERLGEATHYELQRPTEWTVDRVRFALTEGKLPADQQLYAFVFDDHGQVTEQGEPITLPTDADPDDDTIESAIDSNDDGEIDDSEVFDAIRYWQEDEPVPGTDGKTIDDGTLLDLVERWQEGS
jgi:hypothetical protein